MRAKSVYSRLAVRSQAMIVMSLSMRHTCILSCDSLNKFFHSRFKYANWFFFRLLFRICVHFMRYAHCAHQICHLEGICKIAMKQQIAVIMISMIIDHVLNLAIANGLRPTDCGTHLRLFFWLGVYSRIEHDFNLWYCEFNRRANRRIRRRITFGRFRKCQKCAVSSWIHGEIWNET